MPARVVSWPVCGPRGRTGGVLDFKAILAVAAALSAPALAHAQTTTSASTSVPAPKAETRPAPSTDAKPTTVETVTVQGDRNATTTSIDRRSYSVANDLQATTGSISDALRNVPGVQVDVQGNVSLRGSGVTILVDGKPSTLFSGEGQADALQNMPADQIERVEVMTNPSAEFSPEGRGGVINLVTRRTRRQVRTATVRANAGDGGAWNGGVSASLMNGPLSLTGNASLRANTFTSRTEGERESLDPVSGLFEESRDRSYSRNERLSGQGRLGAEYDLGETTRLSGELRYSRSAFDYVVRTESEGEDAAGVVDNAFGRDLYGEGSWSNTGQTLRYRRQFAGEEHDVTVAVTHDRSGSDRDVTATTLFATPVQPALYEVFRNSTLGDTTRLSVDYNRPLSGDRRLKLGAEFSFADYEYDYLGERGPAPGSTVLDPALTNRFLYGIDTQAIFFTYQRPFGDLTAQFGLRLEADQSDINQVTQNLRDGSTSTGVYPTLHLQYVLNEDQKLNASYSRRIQRPWAADLNPFVIYVDPNNRRAGNPDLRPAITDSFEVGWEYREGQTMMLATVYLRDNFDGVTDITIDLGGGVFLSTKENLASSRDWGLEISASGRIVEGLTYQLWGDVHSSEIDGSSLVAGGDRSNVTWFASATVNWQVTPNDFLQVQGFAWGDQLTPQGSYGGAGGLNLGYRHKFNDDVSLVVTAQDPFGTLGRNVQLIRTPRLRGRSESENGSRSIYVGLTWTFGGGPRRQPDRFEFDAAGSGPPG